MNRTWLAFDTNGVAWAAFHTKGHLANQQGLKTGVTYGVLSDVLKYENQFRTEHVAFCFDFGKSKRCELLPTYKETRKKKRDTDEAARAQYASVSIQIERLRKRHLKAIGYRNVFYKKGFEADDLLASFCLNLPEGDKAIIISGDADMLQLLSRNVSVYAPSSKKLFTKKSFIAEFGITPKQWIDVKCLAGCRGDDVPGIRGIGEDTAIKFIRGILSPRYKAYALIQSALTKGIMKRNLPLVRLPFEGTPDIVPRVQKKRLTFQPLFKKLNIRSLDPESMPSYRE